MTACSQAFAKKVLEAIHTNTEEDLYEQNIRNDSIKFTEWMGIIKDFVLSSENSRPIPGKETVSIKCWVRREKYLLQKSKHEIASDSKKLHPECPFEASTLIREFPQNAVTPTSRDMARNSCPTHSNIRRRVKALHKIGVVEEVPISCRGMVATIMCADKPGVNFDDPITYLQE